MVRRYVKCTRVQAIDTMDKMNTLYLAEYARQYPNDKTRIAKNYTDRMTGEIRDTVIRLSTDGKDHSDRFVDWIAHPEDDDAYLLSYEDTRQANKLNPAYYLNPPTRIARLAADPDLVDIDDTDEAKRQGFFSIRQF